MRVLVKHDTRKAAIMEPTRENQREYSQIASYAFSLRQTTEFKEDESYSPPTIPNTICTYDEDNRAVAGLSLELGDIFIKGRAIGHGGIAGVCCLPWARRQGNVRLSLLASLQYMRELGKPVSALYPFSFSFYRQFGWELGQRALSYKIPMAELASFSKASGSIHRVVLGENAEGSEDLARIAAMYDRWAAPTGSAFVRKSDYWCRHKLGDLNGRRFACIWQHPDGRDGGYIIYSMQRDANVNELKAEEMYYDSRQALEGLFGYIYAHDSMVKTFTWLAPWGTDLSWVLPNPRVEINVVSGMMFRVVDVLPVLEHLVTDYSGPEVLIGIEDPHAPWNQGLYRVAAGCATKANSSDSTKASSQIHLTIQRFSQAVCGYASLSSLIAAGYAKYVGSEPTSSFDSLTMLNSDYIAFMNDYF